MGKIYTQARLHEGRERVSNVDICVVPVKQRGPICVHIYIFLLKLYYLLLQIY